MHIQRMLGVGFFQGTSIGDCRYLKKYYVQRQLAGWWLEKYCFSIQKEDFKCSTCQLDMRNDSRFFLSSASQMLRKKVYQRCDVLCPLLVQTSFRGVCPGDPGPNEVVSTMESWASENYGTIQKETRNVSWLKWTKLDDLFLKKTPVSLLVSPVSEEGKQQRGLYWLLFCGRWVVNGGGENCELPFSFRGSNASCQIFFWGGGYPRKIGPTQNNAIKSCVWCGPSYVYCW